MRKVRVLSLIKLERGIISYLVTNVFCKHNRKSSTKFKILLTKFLKNDFATIVTCDTNLIQKYTKLYDKFVHKRQ